jgi:Na+-translocating ferredoxin:NAD+ oxidoreductase RnfD subunit
MFKRFMRWILPLVVLVVIAMYFVLSPVLASHAATPNVPATHVIAPQFLLPNFFSRH